MTERVLAGCTIGLTADRRRAEQAELFRRRGATVVEGPTIETVPVAADDGLRAATVALLDHPPDIVVTTTGVGVRGWLAAAESWGLDEPLIDLLARTTVAARGPKVVGALAAFGVVPRHRSPTEQSLDLVRLLADAEDLAGARVAVQKHGGDMRDAIDALAAAGADVVEVRVYRWRLPAELDPARRLVDSACAGLLDAITFTTGPAVDNLFAVADEAGVASALRAALNDDVLTACVGPVCAKAARLNGVDTPLEPSRARLGSLVHLVTDCLRARLVELRLGGATVVLRAGAAVVDGTAIPLPHRERALLRHLARHPGRTVGRSALRHAVWGERGDDRLVAVTVSRLRRRLGPAGEAIRTVPRRGYRLALDA